MVNNEEEPSVAGVFSFPAYRSPRWLEQHRLMPAVQECLEDVIIQPKSLLQYSHIRAYKTKAENVRHELRNALFRQALFKVQNIEVLSLKKCTKDRILQKIIKVDPPSYLESALLVCLEGKLRISRENNNLLMGIQRRPIIAEELWKVDRCGSMQSYKVRYYREGEDGFTCRVYTTTVENFLNFLRYYMSF